MLRIHFTYEDLARVRIADRPDALWEVLLSLHVLQTRGRAVELMPWRRQTLRSLPRDVVCRLAEIAPPRGISPDFMTPSGGAHGFGDGMEIALRTPKSTISTQIAAMASQRRLTPWVEAVRRADGSALRTLGRAVAIYHEGAIAPVWSSLTAVVEADRQVRALQMSGGGLEAVLAGIPGCRWRAPVLEIANYTDAEVHLEGRGLLLQPSYFCEPEAPIKLCDPGPDPMLVYPTAKPATGLTAESASGESCEAPDRPLIALLGRTRAAALAAVRTGCSTGELARRCQISVGSASQQATILREGGLITTRREGNSVRHEITRLGVQVLSGASSS
ncbi:DNA-binding transcriptional regulator, ArsR family [Nocardioides sp. YR527]|uniref:ArsR/SmtB family transcription factor n=1 Tax=Nocardioides sp. YR527 TaxID=1881028 RepID=UPI00088A9C1A|nr:winged helix-turn-helix domain-containing protein [Nocardioides sp. YR527]SDL22424.1 DNA-binding transcriptional regulator, ArsR family [Nocardioides sp. YR527]